MELNYIRKAILTFLTLAMLCQSFNTYFFEDNFRNLSSVELDLDLENESENSPEEQKSEFEEDKKDKTYPKDNRLKINHLSTKNHHYFKQSKISDFVAEILLPPPRIDA